MIRVQGTRRVVFGLLVVAAMLAAACEIEPTDDALPPLKGDVPTEGRVEVDGPPDTKGGGEESGGADADGKGSGGSGDDSGDGKSPPSTTAPPTTASPTTAPPTTEEPDYGGGSDDHGDHGGDEGSGDHSGHGMPYVNASAIPSGSSGVGSALLGTTTSAPATDDIQGALVMFCQFSHMNFDDPIVFPGVRDATHLHAFFGNTGANFASTPESIRNSGNSTCLGGTANRSSYWVQALIDTRDGAPVRPHEMVTYYTHGRVPGPEIEPHPAGLQILAGSAMSSSDQRHVRWWCPGDHGHYESYISPNCNPNEELKLSVTFPQCWNGRDIHSTDQSHMAYPGWNTRCPDSHPIAVPQVNLNVIWHLDGHPTTDLRLSSDMYSHDIPGGYSGHADWFDGWDREILETWVRECVNQELYCFHGNLGNGQALQRP